jgi:hypothetical protein
MGGGPSILVSHTVTVPPSKAVGRYSYQLY